MFRLFILILDMFIVYIAFDNSLLFLFEVYWAFFFSCLFFYKKRS